MIGDEPCSSQPVQFGGKRKGAPPPTFKPSYHCTGYVVLWFPKFPTSFLFRRKAEGRQRPGAGPPPGLI